jgi:hypothetical protein
MDRYTGTRLHDTLRLTGTARQKSKAQDQLRALDLFAAKLNAGLGANEAYIETLQALLAEREK